MRFFFEVTNPILKRVDWSPAFIRLEWYLTTSCRWILSSIMYLYSKNRTLTSSFTRVFMAQLHVLITKSLKVNFFWSIINVCCCVVMCISYSPLITSDDEHHDWNMHSLIRFLAAKSFFTVSMLVPNLVGSFRCCIFNVIVYPAIQSTVSLVTKDASSLCVCVKISILIFDWIYINSDIIILRCILVYTTCAGHPVADMALMINELRKRLQVFICFLLYVLRFIFIYVKLFLHLYSDLVMFPSDISEEESRQVCSVYIEAGWFRVCYQIANLWFRWWMQQKFSVSWNYLNSRYANVNVESEFITRT